MTTDYISVLRTTLLGFSLLLANMVGAAADQPLPPEFDLSQLTVEFKVNVLGVIPVTGLFRDVRGSFVKPASNRNSALNITVCLNSVDTRDAGRDRLLRSQHFFDVERFPAIRFNDARVVSSRNGARHLAGELTLHGVSRPVVFSITEPRREAVTSAGTPTAVAARTTISRSAFGLDAFPLVVSDEVEITVHLKGDLVELQNHFRKVSSGSRQLLARPH